MIGADCLAFLSMDGLYRAMGEGARDPRSAIHRPLFHRRLSHRADRSDGGERVRTQLSLLAEAGGGRARSTPPRAAL